MSVPLAATFSVACPSVRTASVKVAATAVLKSPSTVTSRGRLSSSPTVPCASSVPADPDSANWSIVAVPLPMRIRRRPPLRKVQFAEGHAQFRERHRPGEADRSGRPADAVEAHADAARQPVGSARDRGRVQAHHAGSDTGWSTAPRDLHGQGGQQIQRNLAGRLDDRRAPVGGQPLNRGHAGRHARPRREPADTGTQLWRCQRAVVDAQLQVWIEKLQIAAHGARELQRAVGGETGLGRRVPRERRQVGARVDGKIALPRARVQGQRAGGRQRAVLRHHLQPLDGQPLVSQRKHGGSIDRKRLAVPRALE